MPKSNKLSKEQQVLAEGLALIAVTDRMRTIILVQQQLMKAEKEVR